MCTWQAVSMGSAQVHELRTGRTTIAAQIRDLTAARASAEAEAAAARGQATGLQAACRAHVVRLEALSAQLSELQQAQAQVRLDASGSEQRGRLYRPTGHSSSSFCVTVWYHTGLLFRVISQ